MKKRASPGRKRAASQPQSQPQERGIDLASLFNTAAQTLAANQSTLNQADTVNQNHGDNMVQVFHMISQAVGSQPEASPAQQLSHASQYLAQNATNGSAQVYSQGLAQAAQQFQGQSAVTPENIMLLIQSLLGSGQASSGQGGGDLLGSLLGGGQGASQGGDLLGTLLGGGQSTPSSQGNQQQGGFDLGDLVNAGMNFMNARQQGQDTLHAALSALMSTGPMAQKPYRQQSGQLVADALLQAIARMTNRK